MNQNTSNKYRPLLLHSLLVIIFLQVFLFSCNHTKSTHQDLQYDSDSTSIQQGRNVFTQYCASCHSLQNNGFGPPLGGITKLLSKQKLTNLVRNISKEIESGDSRSTLLKAKYKLLMPPFDFLEDDKVSNVLSYINHKTEQLQLEHLVVNAVTSKITKNLVPPVEKSSLRIELEDYAQIPRTNERPSDKGLATLRSSPLSDETYFVSDQIGIIYTVSGSNVEPFLDITDYHDNFIVEPGIGTGLGSFAFHPGFSENGLFYTTHAEKYIGQPAINDGAFPDSIGVGLQWVLSEWKLNDIRPKKFAGKKREILRLNTPTTAHGVQDIGFAPIKDKNNSDYGMLYLGIGDGGSNNIKMPELCHDIRSLLGTIIRIDPTGDNSATGNYGIPDDNPFANDTDPLVRKEIWAYGFRNPHRMCWDMRYENRHLVADIGEANIEELNVVEKGGDYGWSKVEGNYGISSKEDLKVVYEVSQGELSNYNAPFGQYDHQDGNAISGGFIYRGPIPELQEKYIFGDIVTGRLFYMNIDKELSDSTLYEISIVRNSQITYLKEITNSNRVHLRIGYEEHAGDLYILTKGDGMIRKIADAYFEENENL